MWLTSLALVITDEWLAAVDAYVAPASAVPHDVNGQRSDISWSDDVPATLFDLPDTDFHARECTFSIAGKSQEAFALVRRHRSKEAPTENRTTKTWLKRCYVRGADMSLLRLHGTSNAVLLEESLIVGYRHPLIDMHGRGDDALDLYCVRSTLVAGHILLRWRSQGSAASALVPTRHPWGRRQARPRRRRGARAHAALPDRPAASGKGCSR